MSQFHVQGGVPLKGSLRISGAKNAALPIIAACLLTEEPCVLKNVPDISDVHAFLKILEGLGAEITWNSEAVCIHAKQLNVTTIPADLVKHMRASILLLGPLLGRFGEAKLAYPGGCVLGKRSVGAHVHALQALGAEILEDESHLHFKAKELKPTSFILSEASVTATENAVMAAVTIPGTTVIRWAAMEPHVQDLCRFLRALGADIRGIGTHTLTIHGGKPLHGGEYTVTPDYLELGTLTLAAVLTQGEVTLTHAPVDQLDSFWQKLEELGANIQLLDHQVKILPAIKPLQAVEKLQTSVYPGFATDLQAPFAVLLTQCEGISRVHETLFEGRLNYLAELERMGSKVSILNPHEAIIEGPTRLKGAPIVSHDIRAGAAMVLAALIAEGDTTISDINYIDRGYERLDEKLRQLGAKIERSQD